MRIIIKHKSRRRYYRHVDDNGYYTVEGAITTGDIEEAADIAFEIWKHEVKHAPQAPTLWDEYGVPNYMTPAGWAGEENR